MVFFYGNGQMSNLYRRLAFADKIGTSPVDTGTVV